MLRQRATGNRACARHDIEHPQLEARLGTLFEPMLQAMTDRGPDSAGFAIYGDEVAAGWVKLTLQATTENFDWNSLMGALEGRLGCSLDWFQNASAAVLKVNADEASVLPVWLVLAPRDYLSTFLKIGTIVALAIGILDRKSVV